MYTLFYLKLSTSQLLIITIYTSHTLLMPIFIESHVNTIQQELS